MIQYSAISFVKCNYAGPIKTQLYPTVSTGLVSILFDCDKKLAVVIQIIDLNGHIVYSEKKQVNNAEVYNIDMNSFSAGNYICSIHYNGIAESHSFIKLK